MQSYFTFARGGIKAVNLLKEVKSKRSKNEHGIRSSIRGVKRIDRKLVVNKEVNYIALPDLYKDGKFEEWLSILKKDFFISEKNKLGPQLSKNSVLASLINYTYSINFLKSKIKPRQMGVALAEYFGISPFYKELQPQSLENNKCKIQWAEYFK